MSRDIIAKSGWMYRQKTVFQKKWKRKWMVLYQDGRVSFRVDSTSQKPGNSWDLRKDCMYIWDEKQCQHVLPPAQTSSACIFELLFVGNKRLTLCAPGEMEAQHWRYLLEKARTERDCLTPRYSTTVLDPIDEADTSTEKKKRSCCVCTCLYLSFHNQVREISYLRPATQGSTRRRQKHKRRVSWNDNITMIS